MSATNHTAAYAPGTSYTNACAVILALMLLAGCARVNTAQTTAPGPESRVCNNDTDTFCIENDQQKAAKLNQIGLEFASKENYDQALQSFKQATELDSTNPEYYYSLGLAYFLKGMYAEAEVAYMAALVAKPDDTVNSQPHPIMDDAYYNLACLYAVQGKKDQAFEQLDKLATLGSNQQFHLMQSDKDLDSLRDDPRFKPALDKIANSRKSPEPAQPAQ